MVGFFYLAGHGVTLHRVLNVPGATAIRCRSSCCRNTPSSKPAELPGPDNPAKYPPVTIEAFTIEFLDRNYANRNQQVAWAG